MYGGIRDANFIIGAVENSSLTEEVKENTIAQAQFYRAYFYFRLTTLWSDVPYWRDPLEIDVVSMLGTTERDVIMQGMIEDLNQAISGGFMSTDMWMNNNGRPTVWSARMLKAHFHMWQEEYAEARTELAAILNNSPHPELGPYGDIFREGNDLHPEIIYGVEYLVGIVNNTLHNATHPNGTAETAEANAAFSDIGLFTRAAGITLRESFANSFDDNDLRKPYNVFDRYTFEDSTETIFNHNYITKHLRGRIPQSDPLFVEPDANGQSSASIRLMRKADAYLMFAEAEFMLNGSSTDALDAINTVRARAGLPDLTVLTFEDIMNERSWELTAEGMGRKTDLLRWGLLESTILAVPAAEIAAGANPVSIERAEAEARSNNCCTRWKIQGSPNPT